MKRIYLIAIVFVFASISYAQKIELDHDVYDSWKSIEEVKLSNDGRFT